MKKSTGIKILSAILLINGAMAMEEPKAAVVDKKAMFAAAKSREELARLHVEQDSEEELVRAVNNTSVFGTNSMLFTAITHAAKNDIFREKLQAMLRAVGTEDLTLYALEFSVENGARENIALVLGMTDRLSTESLSAARQKIIWAPNIDIFNLVYNRFRGHFTEADNDYLLPRLAEKGDHGIFTRFWTDPVGPRFTQKSKEEALDRARKSKTKNEAIVRDLEIGLKLRNY
jgi:hypothetical protein